MSLYVLYNANVSILDVKFWTSEWTDGCQRDGLKPLEWVWGGKQERRRPPRKDGGQGITERQDTRSLYNYETKKNIEKRKKGGN